MRQVAFWFPISLIGPWTGLMFWGLTNAVPTSAEPHIVSAAATPGPVLFGLSVWAVVIVLLMRIALVFFKPK
jgi:hypothetical protein